MANKPIVLKDKEGNKRLPVTDISIVQGVDKRVTEIQEQLFYDNVDVESSFIEQSTANGREIFDRHDGAVKKISGNTVVSGNLWDEQTEPGVINYLNGSLISTESAFRSVNYSYINSNYNIYFSTKSPIHAFIIFFDSSYSWVGYKEITEDIESIKISPPQNASFFKFRSEVNISYGNTYKNDIMLSQIDEPYKPYSDGLSFKHSQLKELQSYQNNYVTETIGETISTTNQPILLDSINYDVGDLTRFDSIELIDDKVMLNKATGILDVSTLNWSYIANDETFNAYVNDKKNGKINLFLPGYETVNLGYYELKDKNLSGTADTQILLKDTSITSVSDLKIKLQGLTLIYETNTPTTTELNVKSNIDVINDGYLKFTDTEVDLNTTIEYALDTRLEVVSLREDFSALEVGLEIVEGKVATAKDSMATIEFDESSGILYITSS